MDDSIHPAPAQLVATPLMPLGELISLMVAKVIALVPIVENGKLVGVVARIYIVDLIAREFEAPPWLA